MFFIDGELLRRDECNSEPSTRPPAHVWRWEVLRSVFATWSDCGTWKAGAMKRISATTCKMFLGSCLRMGGRAPYRCEPIPARDQCRWHREAGPPSPTGPTPAPTLPPGFRLTGLPPVETRYTAASTYFFCRLTIFNRYEPWQTIEYLRSFH